MSLGEWLQYFSANLSALLACDAGGREKREDTPAPCSRGASGVFGVGGGGGIAQALSVARGLDHRIWRAVCESSLAHSISVYEEDAPELYTAAEHLRRQVC